jgi:hypothetical protein
MKCFAYSSQALERLAAINTDLELGVKDKPITNVSKKFTGCETYSSEPTSEEFYQYVPKLNPQFCAFKEVMKTNSEKITKEVEAQSNGCPLFPLYIYHECPQNLIVYD